MGKGIAARALIVVGRWMWTAFTSAWRAVRRSWIEAAVADLALTVAVYCVQMQAQRSSAQAQGLAPPSLNLPTTVWMGLKSIVLATAIVLLGMWLWHLFCTPTVEFVRHGWRARRAYRALWRIPNEWEAVLKAERAARHIVDGHAIDYRLQTGLLIRGCGSSTDEMTNELCRMWKIDDPKKRAHIASALADISNLLWTHELFEQDGNGDLHPSVRAIEFHRILQLAELRDNMGSPRCWT